MGKSAPAAPDYRGAAVEQGESSKEVTRDQTYANRPDQYTPWGSSTWENQRTIDPATGQPVTSWQQDIKLSPDQQRALNAQQNIQAGRSDIAQGLLGRAEGDLAQPFDYGGLPEPAGGPQAPDYYGQGLSQMGQAPDPNLPSSDPFSQAGRGGAGDPFTQITNFGQVPGQGIGGMMSGLRDRLSTPGRGNVPGAGDPNTLPGRGGMPQSGDPNALPGRGQGPQAGDPNALPGRGAIPGAGDPGALPGRGQGPGRENYQSEAIQRQLDFSGAPEVGDPGDIRNRAEQAIYDRSTSRLNPQFQQREEALQSQLYNQGLRPGDEAFDRAMTDFGTQRTDAYQTAMNESIMGGGAEAQRQFGMNMQGRQQAVGEQSTLGGFANQASQQALNQQLGIGGQRFEQGMMGAQLGDAQRLQAQGEQAQQFGQGVTQGQMTDAQRAQAQGEQAQQFGQGMSAAQLSDSQRAQAQSEQAQQFGQGVTQSGIGDAQRAQAQGEQAQQFGQGMQSGQMRDAQRAQAFAEQGQRFGQGLQGQQAQQGLQAQQFQQAAQLRGEAGAAAGGQFDQQMRLASMADQQRQQQVQEQLAYGGQGFQQQQQAAAFQNQLRQQAIAEQMQRRGMSINEINALMTGQQVATPQMPSFMGASKADTVNYSGAAQQAGQYGLDKFSADQAMMQSVLSGASNVGGAFAMSDLSLKDNIRYIGQRNGMQWIGWTWNKSAEEFDLHGSEVGYSAREVSSKYPQHVSLRKGKQMIHMAALEQELEAA